MDSIFIYLLKSGGLLATFFVVYYLFLRKETFFKSNRWFLLVGYALSMLLPLMTITKTVWISRPKLTLDQLMAMAEPSIVKTPPPPSIDWSSILLAIYIGIAMVFIGRLVFQLISVISYLKQRNSAQQDAVKLVDVDESVAPFSFFNYIVINSQLYTEEERLSILLHEQIHSQQRHSIDVLIAHIVCGLFWFNPFVWAYNDSS